MKVLIIFGGKSTEHEVSCVSAASVLNNIKGHEITKFGITKEGKWYHTDAENAAIADGSWENDESNAEVFADFNSRAFVWDDGSITPDVIFPVLHGKNGEDGTIQGLFELMNIPYVGCRVLGSSVCMDKAYTKMVFEHAGIKQVPWVTVEAYDYRFDPENVKNTVEKYLKYPVFVKPSNAGSSVGITKCRSRDMLSKAFDEAFEIDRRVVVEQGIENPQEIEVAVLGNEAPVASCTGRIIPANEFYDYEAKYSSNDSKLLIPSGTENEDFIKKEAVKAYKACDCKGMSRVDFLVAEDGGIYLNEINTIPGFTSISMYPKLFGASGLEYSELIDRLLELAVSFSEVKCDR